MESSTGPKKRRTKEASGKPPDGPAGTKTKRKQAVMEELAAAVPHNRSKAREYGGGTPPTGQVVEASDPIGTGSTLSEAHATAKTGAAAEHGANHVGGELGRVRVDSSARALTTNQGVAVADDQSSLKAGLRGPALLEDFILREKLTHFDHERIPERIVHARGSAAHGYFECYESLAPITRASVFSAKGKRTPVFVRFSTVAGERGSADTARDARGFAIKLYTDEGNWDLVGNNIPVFFIQDAMKFPDLVHAVKPEPHHGMPQAASAHDTFWDFVSLMPESTHMLMWVMSDRGIPRSYRTMQGFGVHTFRFVNAAGEGRFVKFHFAPKQGTHSLVWDEAVKVAGADTDFHRRDLWESIEAGACPEWEMSIQVFDDEQAEAFSFDVLDATKLVPEELVPLIPVGRLVLDRNPDNFFAETEQVAFCAAHLVPGIDFTNDPLLAGRIHSYVDTQLGRLGGPNFHEIPINAPLAPVHNHQRDGLHRQAIPRGRIAYEPNTLGGGCPFQAGAAGFGTFPEPTRDDKVRGKPQRFAEHYNQATLFWNSQSDVEKAHIAAAFRFELTKVEVVAIRSRMVSSLRNVSEELARTLAASLGLELPPAMPRAIDAVPVPEVERSASLSLLARPGDVGPQARRVAILVGPGVDGARATRIHDALSAQGAVPRFLGTRLGAVASTTGEPLAVEATLETSPSALWDAVVVCAEALADAFADSPPVVELVQSQYRHGKPILVVGEGAALLDAAGVPATLPSGEQDPGVVRGVDVDAAVTAFVRALSTHRVYAREDLRPAA